MSIKIGSSAIDKIYVGSTPIEKIYVGSELVYKTQSLPPGYTDTGLGWAAKTEYLIYDADTELVSNSQYGKYYKRFAGWAICVAVMSTNQSWNTPWIISTDYNAVLARRQNTNYAPGSYTDQPFDGLTFHLNNSYGIWSGSTFTPAAGIQVLDYSPDPIPVDGSAPYGHTVFATIASLAGLIVL